MATRPVFAPDLDLDQPRLIIEHEVDFHWVPASTPHHERENITRLHKAAGRRNLTPLLEVSAEAGEALGAQVSAANLTVEDDRGYLVPLEAAYQGSKVFTEGGQLVGFRFAGLEWGLKSGTMFYDWLTVMAIHRRVKLRHTLLRFKGFTDLECHPGADSICHARSCALFVALTGKKLIDEVTGNQDRFIETLLRDPFFQSSDGGGS
jgi:hypothetical protein